jgi:hypothetical protein
VKLELPLPTPLLSAGETEMDTQDKGLAVFTVRMEVLTMGVMMTLPPPLPQAVSARSVMVKPKLTETVASHGRILIFFLLF